MEKIGNNIVRIQELLDDPQALGVRRVRNWQIEAEHILAMAKLARDKHDIAELRMLDAEAAKLITERERNLGGEK